MAVGFRSSRGVNGAPVLAMGQNKRFVSLRLYSADGSEGPEKDMVTTRTVYGVKAIVGGNWFTIASRRSQFHDSKLLHVRSRRNYTTVHIFLNGAGFGLIPVCTYMDLGNVKNGIVFAMVFFFLAHKIWKIVKPWLLKYWRE